jgi:hypothetical protein
VIGTTNECDDDGWLSKRLPPRRRTVRSRKAMNMNTLVRWENKWNPFREMDDLPGQLNALIGRAFGRMPMRGDADKPKTIEVQVA